MGGGRFSRSLCYHSRRLRPIINIYGLGPEILCLDRLSVSHVMLDDVNEMFDKVVPKAGYRPTSTHETNESSPSEHNHHPRYRHRRSENLQNNQDGLLPRSESTQVDRPQTCSSSCADAEEERVDVSGAELSIGCPEDDRPEERDQDAKMSPAIRVIRVELAP